MINIDKGVSIILHDWLNVRKDEMIHFITDETHLREAEAMERWAYGADAIAHTDDGKTVFVTGAIAGDVVEAHIVQAQRKMSSSARLISPSSPPTPSAPR